MFSVAAEESELLNDSKYRLYVSSVDKALKSFEYTSEWADLISALGKLNKILSNHTKYPVIPRRMKISKRLAQCLHPALPSGVHLKALETYDIMFRTMGTNRLSQELFIYSSGLFPVLGHAATNVKPSLLTIYETHFVPLRERLGPGLNGFLSGVLPGLEEGTDYYERTNLLLEKVCSGVNPFSFYTCLWECLVTNAAVRLPAIIFVLSHFDRHLPTKDQIFLMGSDVDLMVNGLCTCFRDESVLIQRSALDFLLIGFPMHDTILSRHHCQRLLTSALLTLLRRDMSLNRRLFAWLLGSDVNSNSAQVDSNGTKLKSSGNDDETTETAIHRYFEAHSKDLLISAIRCFLKKVTSENPHDLRPYRILISLLDKSDIGPIILDDILFEVFRLLYLCWREPGSRAPNGAELLKSANLLFSSLEPRYLWQYVGMLFSQACCQMPASELSSCDQVDSISVADNVMPVDSGDPSLVEVCNVIIFLLDTLSLEIYSETFSEYLPSLFLHVIVSLTDHCDAIHASQMNASLKLCLKILSKVRSPVPLASSFQTNTSVDNTINFNDATSSYSGVESKTTAEPGRVVQLTSSSGGIGVSVESSNSPNDVKDETNAAAMIDEERVLIVNRTSPVATEMSSENTVCYDNSGNCEGAATLQQPNASIIARHREDTSNPEIEQPVASVRGEEPQQQSECELSTMEKCLQYYKKFYVTFVCIVRLKLGDTKSISNLFESLIIKPADTVAEDRTKSLEILLKKILRQYVDATTSNRRLLSISCDCCPTVPAACPDTGANSPSSDYRSVNVDCFFASYYAKDTIGLNWEDPISHASKLLIELSTFQTSVPSDVRVQFLGKASKTTDEFVLPDWLKSLIVCSCWLGSTCIPVQFVAISTLLDLSILCRRTELYTRQQCSSLGKNNVQSPTLYSTNSAPVVSPQNQIVTVVLFVPLLTSNQLAFIEYHTNVFQVIMHWLWLYLADPKYEVKCAELICQLQNTLHSPEVIENCIGEALSSSQTDYDRLNSFRKFVRLWHISREIVRNTDYSRVEDTFYRCMLKILDNLPRSESNCLKLEAENWLFHSLLRGDCGRIVEPLLLILLDRRTARIGVSYAKIRQHLQCDSTQIVDADNNSSIVFVICSVYGSALTYHLLRSPSSPSTQSGTSVTTSTMRNCEQINAKNLLPSSNVTAPIIATNSSSQEDFSNRATWTSNGSEGEATTLDSDRNFADSTDTVSCHEYVKKLPYLQNISVFVNRADSSQSVDDSNETSQTNAPEANSTEGKEWRSGDGEGGGGGGNGSSNSSSSSSSSGNSSNNNSSAEGGSVVDSGNENDEKISRLKYNTLPSIKGRAPRRSSGGNRTDGADEFGSYSSLRDVSAVSSFGSVVSSDDGGGSGGCTVGEGDSDKTAGQVPIMSRVFASDSAVAATTIDPKNTNLNLVRSSSFSSAENGANATNSLISVSKQNRYHSQYLSDGGGSCNNFAAKVFVEDIIAQIVDNVVGNKNYLESISTIEQEEEVDSAISCNSGCSSVTLEYERDNLCVDDEDDNDDHNNNKNRSNSNISHNEDDEHVCKKIVEELERKQATAGAEKSSSPSVVTVQFYSHMLLYCDLYDKNRILYTLEKFRDIIRVNAKIFLVVASTTIIPPQAPLVNLLMKHRNSIFARGFQCNEKPSETFHKNTTYMEVLITVCLYYVRSYYPNFGSPRLARKDVLGNKQVQIASIELLTEIFFQLGAILSNGENEMIVCVRELLNRCKVQKIALHCMWCCLSDDVSQSLHLFVKEVLLFNETNDRRTDGDVAAAATAATTATEYSRAFQVQYLRLLLSLIVLENEIYRKEESSINVVENEEDGSGGDSSSLKCDYVSDKPIIRQPLFLNLLKKTLEPNDRRRQIHERVISFVIASLPYLKKSLAKIIANVIRQLCSNIEASADMYASTPSSKSNDCRVKQSIPPPFNYTITLLDALTILSHYCLLDFNSQLFLKPVSDVTSLRTFKSLFQMYSDFPNSMNLSGFRGNNHCHEAKEAVLDNLPKIFAAVASLWQSVTSSPSNRDYKNVAGNLSTVKNEILNLLNPIAVHHSIHFFVSVAVVWKEKMSSSKPSNTSAREMNVTPEANEEQFVLVRLLCSLASMTPDILIGSVHRIIKQRVVFSQERSAEVEISILEVLVHYIKLVTLPKLMECWNSLVPLLREASNVSVQSQFLLCTAVSQFVGRLPCTPDRLMDKKVFKDVQEIVVKLVEICTQIAGAGLEQTTWLRRNLAVRDNGPSSSGVLTSGTLFSKDSDKQNGVSVHHSPAAQLILAELLVPLLDIVFSNQDKEKCVTLLVNVMYNITPYLRNHTQRNAVNFYACSQLLASISGYQYTRKAWKKDAMDLLLDSSLFQMEIRSLKHWRTIVDNLMCQDISTFRDLLGRVSINQNNTLNLFSSKEQEYELRSQLLKRLAFVILCCEQDQFHKHMPDIQEKLADSLKLPQSTPGIQAQVFLCFRVLLLRMSPHHMTSLWPAIITELVQVMLQLEHELSIDEDYSSSNSSSSQMRSLSGLDWSWSSSSSNCSSGSGSGTQINCHPHWLQLYLAAAKLLKLAVQLPADRLPQFQMYRWAFVGKYRRHGDTVHPTSSSPLSMATDTDSSSSTVSSVGLDFVPHVIRIASLMNNRFGKVAERTPNGNLLPVACQVRTLQDLHPFFAALSAGYIDEVANINTNATAIILEREIESDFLEQLPFSLSSMSSSSSSSSLQSASK